MVEQHSPDLDAVFKALADPTRRAMLQRLADEELSVSALAEPLDMSLAAASKHIQVLERAGLVRRTVHGRTHTCRLDAQPLHAGMEWLRHYERFWTERVDALERLVRAAQASPRPSPKPSPQRRKP
jgi:DNA-binding transcriptional ArsR family regulator